MVVFGFSDTSGQVNSDKSDERPRRKEKEDSSLESQSASWLTKSYSI